jgi:hypothetical protein
MYYEFVLVVVYILASFWWILWHWIEQIRQDFRRSHLLLINCSHPNDSFLWLSLRSLGQKEYHSDVLYVRLSLPRITTPSFSKCLPRSHFVQDWTPTPIHSNPEFSNHPWLHQEIFQRQSYRSIILWHHNGRHVLNSSLFRIHKEPRSIIQLLHHRNCCGILLNWCLLND